MPMQGMGRHTGADTTTLDLNTVEIENLAAFAKQHEKCKVGGWSTRIKIESTPNGVACSVYAICAVCYEKASISDMESW